MRLADVNLLVYAIDETSAHHEPASAWLNESLSGEETVAFSWTVLLAFLRLTTNPRLFASPLHPAEAMDVVDGWLAQPCATVVHPTSRHSELLRDLLDRAGTAGNLTMDAHLAALAIEHGAELYSSDTDFARFPGLRWHNPLGV